MQNKKKSCIMLFLFFFPICPKCFANLSFSLLFASAPCCQPKDLALAEMFSSQTPLHGVGAPARGVADQSCSFVWVGVSSPLCTGLVNFANDGTFLMIDVLVFLGRCFLLQGIRPLVTGLTRNRRKGELEGALKGNLLYPLPQGRINYSYIISDRYLSVLFLKASSDGDPTASPGCRRALIVLIIPKFFLPSSQNLPCCTLSPLFLVLSPADTKNRLFPSSAAALSVFEDFSITSSLVSSRSDQTNPDVTSIPAASPPSKTQR